MNKISISNLGEIMEAAGSNITIIDWHGNPVEVKQTLTALEMFEFVRDVTLGCFDEKSGEYLPEALDFVLSREIVDKYTNIEILDDIEDLYAMLYRTDLIQTILGAVNKEQFDKIVSAVRAKVKYAAETNAAKITAKMDDAVKQIAGLVSQFSSVLDGVTPDDVANLLRAVTEMGKIDEAKLVNAVLEHQAGSET